MFAWAWETGGFIVHCLFAPSSTFELGIYYFLWMLMFIGANVVWDIRTPHTGRFHISNLKDKTTTAYAAATFSSSFVLLLAFFDDDVQRVVGDTLLPLILAGITGVLQSVSEVCPYDARKLASGKKQKRSPPA